MRVLACHHGDCVLFDLVCYHFSLGTVAILEERLKQTAAIVLEEQFFVFSTNQFDSLIDEVVLLFVVDLFFLKHKLVVDQTQVFNQVGYFLLLTARHLPLHWFWRVLLHHLKITTFEILRLAFVVFVATTVVIFGVFIITTFIVAALVWFLIAIIAALLISEVAWRFICV